MSTRVLNDIHNDLKQLIKAVTSYKVYFLVILERGTYIYNYIVYIICLLSNIYFYAFRKMKKDFEDVNDFAYQISNIIATFLLTVM